MGSVGSQTWETGSRAAGGELRDDERRVDLGRCDDRDGALTSESGTGDQEI